MNRKQKIIISVVGIFIVTLALLGLTYGYYLTTIHGNTNTKSVSLSTDRLVLNYGESSSAIVVSQNIMPSADANQTVATKDFYVKNDGTDSVTYLAVLENVENNFIRQSDVVYTLKYCTGTSCTPNTVLVSDIPYPSTTETNGFSVMAENTIASGATHKYSLTIRYKEAGVNQSIDMGKTFSGRVNIKDKRELVIKYNKGTLARTILDSALNETKGTKLVGTPASYFSGVAKDGDQSLNVADDDYGTSLYYRGPVTDNYVSFAGFTWRIVRINGDGTIRLILDGLADQNADDVINNSDKVAFSSNRNGNAYLGYMYGQVNSNNYDTEHQFTGDKSQYNASTYSISSPGSAGNHSSIKVTLDKFYINNLSSYSSYLGDSIFCGDKSLAPETIGVGNTSLGYGQEETYYAATARLMYSDGTTFIRHATPTLKCAPTADNDYSRYTVNAQTLASGRKVNGDLSYPIALISADEVVFAGAMFGKSNPASYIFDNITNTFWTMTPLIYTSGISKMMGSYANNPSTTVQTNTASAYLRPVINLKANIKLAGGDGTAAVNTETGDLGPYTVKLN